MSDKVETDEEQAREDAVRMLFRQLEKLRWTTVSTLPPSDYDRWQRESVAAIEAAFTVMRQEAQRVASAATDATVRAQLDALGLAARFPSLTHLADDMGEALLRAEAELKAAREDNARLRALLIEGAVLQENYDGSGDLRLNIWWAKVEEER